MSDFIADNAGLCLCAVGLVIAFVRIIVYRKEFRDTLFRDTLKKP